MPANPHPSPTASPPVSHPDTSFHTLPNLPGVAHSAPARAVWRLPDFRRLWGATTVSEFGSQVTLVALPLLAAIALGASPGQMGLLAAAGTLPFLFAGLFAGAWVDRLRRRPVLIAADLGRAALLLAIPAAAGLGLLRIELLLIVALLTGLLTVFFEVAYASYLPSLVPSERLVEANSRLQASASLAQVGGPGLAGVTVAVLSAPAAVLLDALSFLVSAVMLGRIATPESRPVPPAERHIWREIGEGLSVVARHPVLRALAGGSATTSFFGLMFLSVYVLYLARDLGLGSAAIGLIFATGGAGALVGSLLAAPLARRLGPGPAMSGALFLFGLSGMLVPLAALMADAALPLVVASEFLQWLTFLVYQVNALSVRQALTTDRLRGRVNATVRFVTGGAQPLGSLAGGALGGLIGLPQTLVVAECGMFLAFLWIACSQAGRLGRT